MEGNMIKDFKIMNHKNHTYFHIYRLLLKLSYKYEIVCDSRDVINNINIK